MLNFDLKAETDGNSALNSIQGDLDVQVAERVTKALNELEAGEPETLVMDLGRLSFLDSSGMAVIAAAHTRATDAGRRFVVVGPPSTVRQAFDLSGLGDVIETADDLATVYP